MGSGSESNADTRFGIGWAAAPSSGIAAEMIRAGLEDSGQVWVKTVEDAQREDLEALVRNGEMAAVVILPEEYTRLLLAGEMPQVDIILDAGSASGQAVRPLILSTISRAMSAAEIAALTAGRGEASGGTNTIYQPDSLPDASPPYTIETALLKAWKAWQQPAFTVDIDQAVAVPVDENQVDFLENPFNQSSPGMIVMFAIFGLNSTAMVLVSERKTRALQRLMTTSMPRAEIIAGHMLAMFGLVLVQELVLAAAGQLIFDVNYLRQPAAVLLVMAGLALWVAAFGMLIGVAARGEDQVVLFAMLGMFLFSALGGAWFPLEVSGAAFASIGRLLPSAWAMTGFQNVLVRGLGFTSVIPVVGVLFGYSLAFFAAAVWRFRN
jgi:ABC-2 type transport system permease protein